MKRPLSTLALVALGALSLFGCRATGSPLNTYVITENQVDVKVDKRNKGLSNTIQVEGVISERRDGFLFVQARLQNRTSGQAHVEWSIEWYDASGLLVGDPTAWEPLRLGGGEIETLRKTAPTGAVTSMRLSVRPSDSVD